METAVIIAVIISAFGLIPIPLGLIITILNLIIPDPIPIADEVISIIAMGIRCAINEAIAPLRIIFLLVFIAGILLLLFYF